MKRPLLFFGLCSVIVGLGWVGARHESKAELQRALASFRANLPPDARFEYDRAYPRILARGAGFENARFTRGSVRLAARHLTVNNPTGFLVSGLGFSRIRAEGVTVDGPVSGTIDDLTLNRLRLPPMSRDKKDITSLPPASEIRFRHGQIHRLDLKTATPGCRFRLREAILDNYGHDDGNGGELHDLSAVCDTDSPQALLLSRRSRLKLAPIQAGIGTLHEKGFRLARMVALIDSGARKPLLPGLKAEPDLWEAPATFESGKIAASLAGLRLTIDTSEMGSRIEGGFLKKETDMRDVVVTGLPPQATRFLPDGIRVAHLVQRLHLNMKSGHGETALTASTPGVFSLEFGMSGANFVPLPNQTRRASEGPLIDSLQISYRDEGNTVDTLLQRIADSQNVPLAQLKARLILPMAIMIQTTPGLSALPGFLENAQGHTLVFALHPPEPLTLDMLRSLGARLKADSAMRQRWLSPPVLTTSLQ
ncbi:hypothetical protein [Swaminathania salitolerans]|uniref:Uncharacterized protein n=1 Tax=Swaminathania salitolerans TaxID=182838 RepID=A0A511BQC7_9PROT|nr:hypothetical protein [Swaminathania salitolerans]GEL02541.1 hypothetical protein SSA02_17040 [Swaminathania salitolerans]